MSSPNDRIILTRSNLQALIDKITTLGIEDIGINLHDMPRITPKDLSPYVADGTLWKRIAGTDGFSLFEDVFVGDYIHMSRPISAYERTGTYQETGSEYVTVADIDGAWGQGDVDPINYHHVIMVPGKGLDPVEKQHFGRSRMNVTSTTIDGYAGSEMYTTTIGPVATSVITGQNLSINQQLFNEFGNHLKTVRENMSDHIDENGYNRFGKPDGCSDRWVWVSAQAVLMSEIEVYGSTVWSSSGYDTGTGCRQLALFRHSKIARSNRTAYWWLKDVASKANFCDVSFFGFARFFDPSSPSYYVRPRFIIA